MASNETVIVMGTYFCLGFVCLLKSLPCFHLLFPHFDILCENSTCISSHVCISRITKYFQTLVRFDYISPVGKFLSDSR